MASPILGGRWSSGDGVGPRGGGVGPMRRGNDDRAPDSFSVSCLSGALPFPPYSVQTAAIAIWGDHGLTRTGGVYGGSCHLVGSSTFGQVTVRLCPAGLSVGALGCGLCEGRASVFLPSLRAGCCGHQVPVGAGWGRRGTVRILSMYLPGTCTFQAPESKALRS